MLVLLRLGECASGDGGKFEYVGNWLVDDGGKYCVRMKAEIGLELEYKTKDGKTVRSVIVPGGNHISPDSGNPVDCGAANGDRPGQLVYADRLGREYEHCCAAAQSALLGLVGHSHASTYISSLFQVNWRVDLYFSTDPRVIGGRGEFALFKVVVFATYAAMTNSFPDALGLKQPS